MRLMSRFLCCRKTNSIEHAHARNVDYDVKKKYMLVSVPCYRMDSTVREFVVARGKTFCGSEK